MLYAGKPKVIGGATIRTTAFWCGDVAGAAAFAVALAAAAGSRLAGASVPWWIPALLLAAVLVRSGTQALALISGDHDAAAVKAALRGPMFERLLSGGPGRHVMLGESVADATDRVEDLHGYHARFRPLRAAAVVAPLLAAGAVALASPVSALILLATLLPFAAGMALAGIAAGRAARAQLDALGRLSGLFVDRIRALPVILGFGAEDRIARQLASTTAEVAERTIAVLRTAFLSGAVLEFFAALSVALVAVYCGFSLLGILPFPAPERLDLAEALFVLVLAPEFYLPMRRLAAAYHDRQIGLAAMERLQASPLPPVPAMPAPVFHAPPALRFEGVVVDHGERAIGPFDIDVPAGRTTALLGPSGAGKSSLLHALLGLAPVGAGRILVDGTLLPDGGLRGGVSWAGQGVALVPGSLADNIRLADPSAGDEAVEAAARRAGLDAVLATRRDGLGMAIDAGGSGLSGGERRRIGLARAMLRAAPLWLLDEPTADLDEAGAMALMRAILAARADATLLLVTHNPAVAGLADHRVVLP